MNNLVVSPQGSVSPYQARRVMLSILEESQAVEHQFFEQCRAAVRHASTRLADHFSDLIQRRMPQWGEDACHEFALQANVPGKAVTQWRQSHRALINAQSDAMAAELAVKRASAAKSDSGGFFGAKKGREQEHRIATANHAAAVALQKSAQDHLKACVTAATEAAATLLRRCVAGSGHLAERTGYDESRVPREILTQAAQRATELTTHHDREQSRLNAQLAQALQILSGQYGVANE